MGHFFKKIHEKSFVQGDNVTFNMSSNLARVNQMLINPKP